MEYIRKTNKTPLRLLWFRTIKRLMDLVLGTAALVFFSPIMLLTAIAIKLDSKGPVLVDEAVPPRVGLKGKQFRLFKFRTMIPDAHQMLRTDPKLKKLYEKYKKNSFKLKEDPRVTRVGKFIRKHSVDELPQLFNVLRGEMSLVGPRPYLQEELDNQQKKYPETKKFVKKMLQVKPGITGLWQVSGRSEVNFDRRIMLDAKYADCASIFADVIILLKSPWTMISGKGAV